MAVVVVRVPPKWVSTSPTAMAKAVGIVHIGTGVAEYSGRYGPDRGPNGRLVTRSALPGEHYVRTLCGKSFDAIPMTRQRTEPCKQCERVLRKEYTSHVHIEPPVHVLDEAFRRLDEDARQARREQSGQGELTV